MLRVYLMKWQELNHVDMEGLPLSDYRKQKLVAYKSDTAKRVSMAAELLLIYGLKQLDFNIKLPLIIKESEYGKPEMAGICFNLSYAGEYCACAISDGQIGIDIDLIPGYPLDHIEKLLTPCEIQNFNSFSDRKMQNAYFCECWVKKESYLKQLGVGLGVRTCDFVVDEDRFETVLPNLPARYVHLLKEGEIENIEKGFVAAYRLAVCCREKDRDSRVVFCRYRDLQYANVLSAV